MLFRSVQNIVQSINARTDESMKARDAHIQELRQRIDILDSIVRARLLDTVGIKDTLPAVDDAAFARHREPETPVDVNQILDMLKK